MFRIDVKGSNEAKNLLKKIQRNIRYLNGKSVNARSDEEALKKADELVKRELSRGL